MSLHTAITLLRSGQPAAARDAFLRMLATDGDSFEAYLGLAYAHAALGDADATLAATEAALDRQPRDMQALMLKADVLARRGDPQAAAFYEAVVKVAPPSQQRSAEVSALVQRAAAAVDRVRQAYEARLREHMAAAARRLGPPSPRFARSVELLAGTRQLYLQSPTMYCFPELPHVQWFDPAAFEWVRALDAASGRIRAELEAVLRGQPAFEPYLKSDNARPMLNRSPILDNPDWGAYFLWKDGSVVPEHAAACPDTMRALEAVPLVRIPRRSPNVLFSLMRPGAHIPPHNGFINTRLICHLPLIVPPGCSLRVGDETRDWVEGRTWLFDDTIEHEAWNRSAQLRVVLLFEVWRPELDAAEREYVVELFAAIERERGGIADWGI